MTSQQQRWATAVADQILRSNKCSVRDGSDLKKLSPEERKDRQNQQEFEKRFISTPTGGKRRSA